MLAPRGVVIEAGVELRAPDVVIATEPNATCPAPPSLPSADHEASVVVKGKIASPRGLVRVDAPLIEVARGGRVDADSGRIALSAASELRLAAGSTVSATGGSNGAGGDIRAWSSGGATMERGAVIDVSGGSTGGNGGFAELSAARDIEFGGEMRAAAGSGHARGRILIDPAILTLTSGTSFVGAGSVVVEASTRIQVDAGATILLHDVTHAGDGTAARQSLTLRSARHIRFNHGSKIIDDGSGASGQKIWDVNLVAGADLGSPDLLALQAGSDGSVHLCGANYDAAGNAVTLQTHDGEVALARGDVTVRAAGALFVGNGGGLRSETGRIDVVTGGDVQFRAGSTSADGVLESGSGDVTIAAGGSVLLVENPNTSGNAAIRTRGLLGIDGRGELVRALGGNIVIEAVGDVDAGIGNRWLEPGLNLTPEAYRQAYLQIVAENPGLGLPHDVKASEFDPMPVVEGGILGIGTEAGGDVTIVAGGSVHTGVSVQNRSGGTAAGLETQYNGSHIGVFGRPVTRALDTYNSIGYLIDPASGTPISRNVPIQGAPENRLTVIAGDAIEGDYAMRHGDATFRSGFALVDGVSAATLDLANVDAALEESQAALDDEHAGWFGTLAQPVTVDSIEASVSAIGRNGVAIRAIENPSLVYPRALNSADGVYAVPTWQPHDAALLRSTHGDVVLVGNEIDMPMADSSTPVPNLLARVLPPNVRIEVDQGDLVVLNDFQLFPSASGGLDLAVGGAVRGANFAASGAAVLSVALSTLGASGDVQFTIPAGATLREPDTGIEFAFTNQVTMRERLPAQPARGVVEFEVAPEFANQSVTVPAGTRVATAEARIYRVTQSVALPLPSQRYSQGKATFYRAAGTVSYPIQIPSETRLVGPDGVEFRTAPSFPNVSSIPAGRSHVTVGIWATTPGQDAPAQALALIEPLEGVDHATNANATMRSTTIQANVVADEVGIVGNVPARAIAHLLDALAGIESIENPRAIRGGAGPAESGYASSSYPQISAQVLGPAGELATGTELQLVDSSILPAGVIASELRILVSGVTVDSAAVPALFRELRDVDGGLRPDPVPGTAEPIPSEELWRRDGSGTSARLRQSDACPSIDARTMSGSFDYAAHLANSHTDAGCEASSSEATSAWLRAGSGFERIVIDLAEPAFALSGDPGFDLLFGTGDDGDPGSLRDFALLTQHTNAADETVVWAPIGDASFGADAPVAGLESSRETGLRVAGPGRAKLLVGVLPNAPQLDTNANWRIDAEENAGDFDGDGGVEHSEWRGSSAAFRSIDEANRYYNDDPTGPAFVSRFMFPGFGDAFVTPAETPYVPSGRGGAIRFDASSAPTSLALLGISTIGNLANPTLPIGGAELFVAADQSIDLAARGSIATMQGGRLIVESVSGGLTGGDPGFGFGANRGITTMFRAPGFGEAPVASSGGGSIGIDVAEDLTLSALPVSTLSGGDMRIHSRDGSIDAGFSKPFTIPSVFVSGLGTVYVDHEGSGIYASSGGIDLYAPDEIIIPEPDAALLMIIASAALAMLRKRRAR